MARLGPSGPQSRCEPFRELILAKMAEDLSAKRIWQDLVETGAAVGYDSVRRFVQRLGRTRSFPFRRMECGPGEEAQVDFGSGAPVITAEGKRRKTYVFRKNDPTGRRQARRAQGKRPFGEWILSLARAAGL